jgi:predicted TPR repeat methyltransferase
MPDIRDRMARAIGLHRHGQLSEAEAIYRDVLGRIPSHFDALHNLAVLFLQRGNHEAALDFLHRAHGINPRSPALHLNIGNVLRGLNHREEALKSYERALTLKPDYAEAYNNRATVLRDLNRNEEAASSAERAIAIKPNYTEAHLNRGHAMDTLKHYEEAIVSYRNAAACGGNKEELHYYLAALGAAATPATSPSSYVENLFDGYAERFDRSLLGLGYGIPEQLFNAIVSIRSEGRRDIADVGCGTGMSGPFLRTTARTLVGVDLSAKMLEKATERAVYDCLVKAEMIDFLRTETGTFDLIVATDVLVYVGDLEPVFAAARTALRRDGQFAFSVESQDRGTFAIRPTRRFAHSLSYLRELAAKHGFIERLANPVVVRLEAAKNIDGFMVVLECV